MRFGLKCFLFFLLFGLRFGSSPCPCFSVNGFVSVLFSPRRHRAATQRFFPGDNFIDEVALKPFTFGYIEYAGGRSAAKAGRDMTGQRTLCTWLR
jgi:hypothetical protein